MNIIKSVLNFIFSAIVLIYIFLEDISVNLIVKPIENWLSKFNLAIKIAEIIKRQNKYLILLLFLLPFLGMEVMGFYALQLLAIKKYFSGIFLYIFKFYLTIPTIFIFRLTKKTLTKFIIIRIGYFYILKIQRFWLYKRIIVLKNTIKNNVLNQIAKLKENFKKFLK